jgi:hypothetical protein
MLMDEVSYGAKNLLRSRFPALRHDETPTVEQCMAESAFCLEQAWRSPGAEETALCLAVASVWAEVAKLRARLESQGFA